MSYSFVKQALQAAGLVKKHRARGRHRRRREPRACFGELLHIDGSPHAWFALAPDGARDADRGARRCDQPGAVCAVRGRRKARTAVMTALRDVFTTYGLPMALYSDRAQLGVPHAEGEGPGGQDAADPGGPGAGAARRRAHPGVLARRRAAAVSG